MNPKPSREPCQGTRRPHSPSCWTPRVSLAWGGPGTHRPRRWQPGAQGRAPPGWRRWGRRAERQIPTCLLLLAVLWPPLVSFVPFSGLSLVSILTVGDTASEVWVGVLVLSLAEYLAWGQPLRPLSLEEGGGVLAAPPSEGWTPQGCSLTLLSPSCRVPLPPPPHSSSLPVLPRSP